MMPSEWQWAFSQVIMDPNYTLLSLQRFMTLQEEQNQADVARHCQVHNISHTGKVDKADAPPIVAILPWVLVLLHHAIGLLGPFHQSLQLLHQLRDESLCRFVDLPINHTKANILTVGTSLIILIDVHQYLGADVAAADEDLTCTKFKWMLYPLWFLICIIQREVHQTTLTEVCHFGHFWLSYGRSAMSESPMGRSEGST